MTCMYSQKFCDQRFFHEGTDRKLPAWLMDALRDERDILMRMMLTEPKDNLCKVRDSALTIDNLITVLEHGEPALATVTGTSGSQSGIERTDFPGGPV